MMVRILAYVMLAVLMSGNVQARSYDVTLTQFPALEEERDRLVLNGAANISALTPLIRDFQQMEPHVAVDFSDYVSNDLHRKAARACETGQNFGDLLLSPSTDQMVKLANDGCAIRYMSPESENLSVNWRDEVYGFTFEPAVIVYHSDYVLPQDVPHTRGELADLLRRKEDFFRGRVATFDLRRSGVGYLLAFLDAEQNSTAYGRMIESMSRVDAELRCCSRSILKDIADRKLYLGYNVLGSYAYAASLRNPKIKIVLPRDYTLVLSRTVLIPKNARHPAVAGRFIRYLLSDRGRRVAKDNAFFFSREGPLPQGIDAPSLFVESGVARPVQIGPALLAMQDEAQRKRFINEWIHAMGLSKR